MKKYAAFAAAALAISASQAMAAVSFSVAPTPNSPGFETWTVIAEIDGVQNVTSYDVEFAGTFQQYNGPASPTSFTDIGDFDAGNFDADPRTTLGDDTHFLVDHSATTLALTDSESTTHLEAAQAGLNGGAGAGATFNLAQLVIPVGSIFTYDVQLTNAASQIFQFTGSNSVAAVPEPTMALVFAGLAGVVGIRRVR